MQSSPPDAVELARQGDPRAISFLMNRYLNPKGITAKAGLKDTWLQVFLESEEFPDKSFLVSFVKGGVTKLGIRNLTGIKVYGRLAGTTEIAWIEEISLEKPIASSSPLGPTSSQISSYSPQKVGGEATVSIDRSVPTDKLSEAIRDAIKGLKVFAINPVGELPVFYKSLGKQRALAVGIVFGLFYSICLLFTIDKIFSRFYYLGEINALGATRVIALGATQFISLIAASILTRKVCRGFGSPEGDVFIAGSALLAPGILLVLSSLFGVVNSEIILIISVLALTYLILTLYTGCSQISQIPEPLSPLAVVFMLLLSLWFSKIIISAAI